MMLLASLSMVVPSAFHRFLGGPAPRQDDLLVRVPDRLREPLHVAAGSRRDLDRHAGGRGPRYKPLRYLQPGDVVEMGITGLGTQRHKVVDRRS